MQTLQVNKSSKRALRSGRGIHNVGRCTPSSYYGKFIIIVVNQRLVVVVASTRNMSNNIQIILQGITRYRLRTNYRRKYTEGGLEQ